mgnify:CR=1 FL=1
MSLVVTVPVFVIFPDFNGTYTDEDVHEYYDVYYVPSATETFIHYFYLIVFPYILLFGTIGNILSITIMRRYSHNIWSTCMYMAIILPMDLIKLYVECGNDWLQKLYNDQWSLSQEILLLSNAVCKVYTFTYSLLLQEAEWIMVAVAIETVIAVKKPLLIYTMCTRERGSAIVLFISVILISLNLHYFWTHGLVVPGDDPSIDFFMCTYISELSDKFRDYIWPVINFCAQDMLPFVVILASVVYMCLSFIPRSVPVKAYDKLLEKYFLDIHTLHEMKKAMVGVCVVGLVSLLCGVMDVALRYFSNKNVIQITYDNYLLVSSTLSVLSYLFMSHKFWILYMCCEKFRVDVKQLLKSVCMPWKQTKRRQRCTIEDRKDAAASVSWQETETCLNNV